MKDIQDRYKDILDEYLEFKFRAFLDKNKNKNYEEIEFIKRNDSIIVLKQKNKDFYIYVFLIYTFLETEATENLWNNGKIRNSYFLNGIRKFFSEELDKYEENEKDYVIYFLLIGTKDNIKKYLKVFFSNPDFLDIRYNFFRMEAIFSQNSTFISNYEIYEELKSVLDNKKNELIIGNINFLVIEKNDDFNLKGIVEETIKNIIEKFTNNNMSINKIIKIAKKRYWKTFLEPYLKLIYGINYTKEKQGKEGGIDSLIKAHETYVEYIRDKKSPKDHQKTLDIFRLPIPFYFYEFINVCKKFHGFLNRNIKIKILLLDNKPLGKFKKILKILKKYKIYNFFEIDYEKDFSNVSSICLQKYSFILLDFFLDKEDMFLAHDLIEKIEMEKQKNNDFYKTWFFMVSAYSESLVKYLQSGVITETYPTCFIDFGAEPDENRSIIFVYKFLKFINNRLENFNNLHEKIKEEFFDNGDGNINNKSEIKKYFFLLDELIKETEIVGDIFFNNKELGKKLYIALKNLLESFLYISPVDWVILERQIDYINYLLKDIKLEENIFSEYKEFNNKFILNTLDSLKKNYPA